MMLATEQGWRALLTSSLSFCLLRTAIGCLLALHSGLQVALALSQLFPGCLLSRFFLAEEERHGRELAFIPHSLCPLCPLTPEPEGLQALQTEPYSLAVVPPADLFALISK